MKGKFDLISKLIISIFVIDILMSLIKLDVNTSVIISTILWALLAIFSFYKAYKTIEERQTYILIGVIIILVEGYRFANVFM